MHIDVDKQLLKSLLIMVDVVESRDAYTGGHVWRVSQFAKLLGTKLGLSHDEVVQISISGYLHDLGKIGVPDAILHKPGKLTRQEYETMRTHPTIGARLIHEHPLVSLAYDPILHHHEREDGLGYPYGLGADAFTLHARIVGVADAFDAMTSTRPYRRGMPIETALSILQEEKGKQFDGSLVEHMLDLALADDLDHIVGHSDLGIPLASCPHCGPVIVVPRAAQDGETVYCRACTGEFRLYRAAEAFEVEPTGKHGTAKQIQPEPNLETIDDIVEQTPSTLDISDAR